jgi:hypothetical protein
MKSWQYTTTLILGVLCVGLSTAIVIASKSNMSLQDEIQVRQQQLNNSVLGQQARQITDTILQDMATVAAKSERMRLLLSKYGYNIKPAPQAAPKKTDAAPATEEK